MKHVRKLVISIFTLLVVVICFTTTTYAWFKNNSLVIVETLEFKATSGLGFLVSIDNEHYYNDLSNDKIMEAIILASDSRFELKNEELYYKNSDIKVSHDEMVQLYKKNKLIPRTSYDGINLTDMYHASASPEDGSYIEFSIYFKAASNSLEDNKIYDIYLLGHDEELIDGRTVKASRMESVSVSEVDLVTDLTTYEKNYHSGEKIYVYSSNAMRMSIQDTTLENPKATIYEMVNDHDLGSYATDYDGDDPVESKLYNSKYNAGFTYYNNLRRFNKIEPIDYVTKPKTYRDISDTSKLEKITRVKSGEEGKKITFRIWLEGWDADCFDGIAKNINVGLSFTSIKVEEEI